MVDVARVYTQWVFLRAVFHRGWWLVTSLYLVVVADLSPFELVFVGTAQNLTALLFEVPTGVLADTVSRKWSVVMAHVLMGIGMMATGMVTAFPALVATQMIWGLAWTFSSGADVAWLTDELDQPGRVGRVLAAAARWEQLGAAAGLVAFGGLAWIAGLSFAVVAAGVAMLVLGLYVVARFPERRFAPRTSRRLAESREILRTGVALVRRDPVLLVVFLATLLLNGAAEAFDRLYPKELLALGFPAAPDPIVWFTALGLVLLGTGAVVLRAVEARIDGSGVPARIYAAACFVASLGLILLAGAPDVVGGTLGVLLVGGIAWPVTRAVSVIWVNRRATSEVRATVQSLLAQVEYAGEIALGISLAMLAESTSIATAMVGAGASVACAGLLVARSR